MSQIYYDLRGLLPLPIPGQLRMAGMVRTIIEWAGHLLEDPTVKFIAPGQERIIHDALVNASLPQVANRMEAAAFQSRTVWLTSMVYCDLARRDLLSKARRIAAITYAGNQFPNDTSRFFRNTPPVARSIYFLPYVRELPSDLPPECVPVINLFDLIPMLFHDSSLLRRREYDKAVRSVRDIGGHFIVNSRYTRHALVSMYNVPLEKVHVVSLGVDQSGSVSYATPEMTKPYFVCICGDTQPRKNVEMTIKAFLRFQEMTGAPHELHFIGPSSDAVALKMPRKAGAMKTRVKGLGHLSEAELEKAVAQASAGLYLSLHEGFGLPPLEYMKHGLPVICSNVTSIPEVVGDAGILVDPFAVDEIANAMRRLTEDDTLAQELRQRGFERVSRYSWERSAADLSATLAGILKGNS